MLANVKLAQCTRNKTRRGVNSNASSHHAAGDRCRVTARHGAFPSRQDRAILRSQERTQNQGDSVILGGARDFSLVSWI